MVGSDNKEYLEKIFSKVDKYGNTALHIAAQEPITDQKVYMIFDMLEKGALPLLKNKADNTFLEMSLDGAQRIRGHIQYNLDSLWFKHLMSNRKVLESFIELKDDDMIKTIFKRFRTLSDTDQFHPMTLFNNIWEHRNVMENSWNELIIWEAKHHDCYLDQIKKCCHDSLASTRSVIVLNNLLKKVEKSFDLNYCVGRACQSFSLVFFVLKFVDFATDITLNIEYYEDEFKDFPTKSECERMNSPTITCYFHEMHGKILFLSSLCIFVLTYIADLYFVLCDKQSDHYFATLAGFCCWNNFKANTTTLRKMVYFICWIPLSIANHLFLHVYGFVTEAFIDYLETQRCFKTQKVKGFRTTMCILPSMSKLSN